MLFRKPALGLILTSVIGLSACQKDDASSAAGTYTVSSFAGRKALNTYVDGARAGMALHTPVGVATDAQGNVYVADTNINRIRKITPSGIVSTVAGTNGFPGNRDGEVATATLDLPEWVATDNQGNVYVTAANRIRRITPLGMVTTLAGGSTLGMRDGPVSTATFNGLKGIAVDPQRNIYVADALNHRIRKITPAGRVSTVAGGGPAAGPGAYADGMGTAARFSAPYGLALDKQGNIYVAETGYQSLHVRKVTPTGMVSTVATIGTSQVSFPYGIAVDAQHTVFVTERGTGVSNHQIHKITATGTVSLVAGAELGFANGKGTSARFSNPGGIALDEQGNLYVADTGNDAIRRISRVMLAKSRRTRFNKRHRHASPSTANLFS